MLNQHPNRHLSEFKGRLWIIDCMKSSFGSRDDVKLLREHRPFVQLVVERLRINTLGTMPIEPYYGPLPEGEPVEFLRYGRGNREPYFDYRFYAPGKRQEIVFFGPLETLKGIQDHVTVYCETLRANIAARAQNSSIPAEAGFSHGKF